MAFKVIEKNILKASEDTANENREVLRHNNVFTVNIISSPGAGKTSLIERVGPVLKEEGVPFTVITGDCFTTRDAERIDVLKIPVIQINTGNACHINGQLIKAALKDVDLTKMDLLIIENVGNLVCPAQFDLGEDTKIALFSVPEGDDKPVKYPLIIKQSRLALINKMDLLEHSDFDVSFCEESIKKINPGIETLLISCKKDEGLDGFISWVKENIKIKKERNR